MTIPNDWKQISAMIFALMSIGAIAVGGGVLGHLLGPAKTFVLIAAAIGLWLIAGWFLGGLRAVLAGLAILTAALAASNANHALAVMLSSGAFLILFADVIARDAGARLKGLD
jgi:hypothetical protein